jgi:two-component system, chemotaxis family, CheB/CheR fusion protein
MSPARGRRRSHEGAQEREPSGAVIVGLGASAGGVESLQQFFTHVPPEPGLAFVVVAHLEPTHPSILVELLARHARIQVGNATHGTRPEPNRVYVIAPGTLLTLEHGLFHVSRPEPHSRTPIDAFFRSLALDQGERAIGAILSGAGQDGTVGLKVIKEHGGLTLAQSPETARHDSMPQSAISAGLVDHVLPVERMPDTILEHDRYLTSRDPSALPIDADVEGSLGKICALVRTHTGHDFARYKPGTLVRRIRRRMQILHIDSASRYLELVEADAAEPQALLKDLLIGVTEFFRDPDAFQALALQVVPRIFQGRPDAPIRIWIPGCASGEEAYSVAILLLEHLERLGDRRFAQIFATDLDVELLAEARQGRYGADMAEHVSNDRLTRFFVRDARGNYQAAKELREMCIFSEHSLIRDAPFSQLDLISCRNVLIYLSNELQKRLVPLFHYALRPGGFLFLGPSEGIAASPELFDTIDKRSRIFRRRETLTRPIVEFPLVGRGRLGSLQPQPAQGPGPRQSNVPTSQEQIGVAFERTLREEYTFPAAVIDERGDALFLAGPIGPYLQLAAGPAGAPNLFDCLRGALRHELRAAVRDVRTRRRRVRRDNLLVEFHDRTSIVRLIVQPMSAVGADTELFFVVLQEAAATAESDEVTGGADVCSPAVEQLEDDLRSTRAELRTTVEELESANEELKSSNEELISTNEELQSANEELETVNTELRQKVDELDAANSDLRNLFAATEIATIFLDRSLRVLKFTPAATALFRLIDADIGRPLADLSPRFAGQDLVAAGLEVLRSLTPVERQVRTADGAWFVVRVLPYRTIENVVSGVVFTFVEVSRVKQAEEMARQQMQLVHLSHDAIFVRRFDGTIESWNRGATEVYGYTAEEAVGQRSNDLLATEFPVPLDGLEAELRDRGRWAGELRHRTKDRGVVTVLSIMVYARGDDGIERILEANRDITERKRDEEALRDSEERFRTLATNTRDSIARFDREGRYVYANPVVMQLLGRSAEAVMGRTPRELGRGEGIQDFDRALREVFECGEPRRLDRRTIEGRWFDLQLIPEFREGEVDTVLVVSRDITDRKQVEDALRESEEKYRGIVETATEGIWTTDTDGRLLFVNERTAEMLGYAPAEMIGRLVSDFMDAHAAALAKANLERRRRGYRDRYEQKLVRKDGSTLWAIVGATPITDRAGKFVASTGVLLDITERKLAEEALRQANLALAEADKRKNEFLAILSHELRNPLAPIRYSVRILERAVPGSEAARRAQEVIDRQTVQLTRLVDDLLDVTRITRGKIQLQRAQFDLNELIRRTISDHASLFEERGIGVRADLVNAELPVNGDQARLAQAVGNLLQNAAKFTPAGGSVTIVTSVSRARARLRVIDTGAGMDQAVLRRLFQPFMQADTTLDRTKGGLGLGLALVKGLVEMHGGVVRAHSEGLGRGAEFVIELPLEEQKAAQLDAPTAPATESRRVLIIEDNVDAADSLRELLAFYGHTVEVAYSGLEGFAKAREFGPQVVLCDIGLPGMDGFEIARAFKSDEWLRRITLIALTGYALPEDLQRAADAGFARHVAKPPSPEELQRVLREL